MTIYRPYNRFREWKFTSFPDGDNYDVLEELRRIAEIKDVEKLKDALCTYIDEVEFHYIEDGICPDCGRDLEPTLVMRGNYGGPMEDSYEDEFGGHECECGFHTEI